MVAAIDRVGAVARPLGRAWWQRRLNWGSSPTVREGLVVAAIDPWGSKALLNSRATAPRLLPRGYCPEATAPRLLPRGYYPEATVPRILDRAAKLERLS